MTVSPVPLETSFSGEDIVIANTRSKAVLRAAAWEFASAHANVDYFPSFEIVMNSSRAETFAPDGIHVRRSVVDRIVDRFVELYMPGAGPRDRDFVEALYLNANPDVLEGIRGGQIVSGFHHWRETGRAEGRALVPEEIPERLYRSGAVE